VDVELAVLARTSGGDLRCGKVGDLHVGRSPSYMASNAQGDHRIAPMKTSQNATQLISFQTQHHTRIVPAGFRVLATLSRGSTNVALHALLLPAASASDLN
jgi:hypothetical protein